MSNANPIPTQQETLEPCPLCAKSLVALRNGLLYCRTFKKDFQNAEDWKAGSCLMAQHNVQLPANVWAALNSRAADAGPRLNERCEWNPVLRVASLDPPRDTDCRNETWWSIGHGDRNFHVCDSCAKLPEFKLRTKRDPINANPAATSSPAPAARKREFFDAGFSAESTRAEGEQECLLCGHVATLSNNGTCMAEVPICSHGYHGTRMCGCKCRFPKPDAVSDSARRAAEEIASWLFVYIFHPSRQGGISESQEAEIAAIISKHFAAAPADNDAESLRMETDCWLRDTVAEDNLVEKLMSQGLSENHARIRAREIMTTPKGD